MRIATHTLGCKLNFSETSHLVRQFVAAGWEPAEFHQQADLYVINTCTVTAIAEKKCRNAIRQAVATNPKAIVAVVGCFAQNAANEIAKIDGVDIILGNEHKHQLLQYVQGMMGGDEVASPEGWQSATDGVNGVYEVNGVAPRVQNADEPRSFQLAYSAGDRTRTFFKIQDGCDYFCTYCAIPFARGRSRSATIAETVAMARQIADSGTKEVVLTGVNTGTFGQHQGETFLQLLKELDQVDGILRYRISSIEPNLITNGIIDFVAQSRKFLPHFHIPLQSGSDKVLKLMHRHYDTAMYAEKIGYLHQVMPDACIAADIMTGFYGETEEEFEKVCRFVEQIPITYLHVFTYSERPNTKALGLAEKVPVAVRRQRSNVLHTISEQKKQEFFKSQHGKVRPVLWESSQHEGKMYGFTDNYIRVQQPYNRDMVNTISSIEIGDSTIVNNFSSEF